MSLFDSETAPSGCPESAPPEPGVVVLGFERVRSSQPLRESGVLICLVNGMVRTAPVAITWEALACLRSELRAAGVDASDAQVVGRVLRVWGQEQIERSLQTIRQMPLGEIVLDFVGGPTSPQPRRLLQRTRLLPPDASAAPRPEVNVVRRSWREMFGFGRPAHPTAFSDWNGYPAA